ncbi:MAG TPA: ATP synthase F0 subunit C [Candidatus Dependentiae bacterium]|jgi:F-type H+-transporting ATPase subunit c|nr:ATP synthase F0 subunit C [Candidatus Dependentiae bacterium]
MEGIVAAKAAACIGAAITMGLGAVGPSLGQGIIGMKACENIGKYPESSSQIRTTMLIAMGFVEGAAIYALLISGFLLYLAGWIFA